VSIDTPIMPIGTYGVSIGTSTVPIGINFKLGLDMFGSGLDLSDSIF